MICAAFVLHDVEAFAPPHIRMPVQNRHNNYSFTNQSRSNTTPITVMGVLGGVVGLLLLMLRWRGANLDTCLRLSVLRHIDEGALKILWSTMQIVSSVQWNLSK
jgi:hypothetical protein